MRVRIIGLVATLALVLSGCALLSALGIPPQNPKQTLLDEFDRNRATWQASGIRRYAFRYEPFCFCDITPHLVIGDDGVVRIDGLVAEESATFGGTPFGVEGLFAIVRRAIDGDQVSTTYDPVTGVPIAMESDPIANAIDDELSFKVTNWTIDPPDDRLLGQVTMARQRWARQQIGAYSMSIRISCDCVYDGRRFGIAVRDGNVTATSRGKRLDVNDLEGVPLTIEALFDFAATWATVHQSNAVFDDRLGYPTHVAVDPRPPIPGQAETIDVVAFTVP